ncbi:carbon-nitrogen hydrolase family protein [Anaerocolumna jejuensis]|uniref:carbon-nitrogen hydrolase family protein n=1 Tax=Anaerocolumna jejuensis TaxID=259063 RepID=UPI003F7BCAD6
MKIAAIQLNADFANVTSNLIQSENNIRQAVLAGAELIVLPEFFPSAIGFSEQMQNVAVQSMHVQKWMKQLAAEYGAIIGGSYIVFDGENASNLFNLVFPNGEIFEHKKDLPTQFENCYYTHGDENNVLVTPIGNFGVAMCWEMIRYDTLRRLTGKVDLVLSGSCWWDLPVDAPPEREPLRQYNQKLACETPITFAKLLGVPIVHANHCGQVTALNFPYADKMQTRQLVGAAQIADGNGNVLARKNFFEGSGFVILDLSWDTNNRKKAGDFPAEYWIPNLPDSYIRAWETINPKGKLYYETVTLPYYKNYAQ